MEKIGIGLLLLLSLSACLKEEVRINFVPQQGLQTAEAGMGSDYAKQLYFNLNENEFVGVNQKATWDFGITTSNEAFLLFANGSKLMKVANFGPVDFTSKTDTAGFSTLAKIEGEDGIAFERNAFGVIETGDLFLIDRGFDSDGSHFGFWKMSVSAFGENSISLTVGALSATSPARTFYLVDNGLNQFYNLESLAAVDVEPIDKDWDLCFTQYTEHFPEEDINYLVTGCLLNRGSSSAVLIEDGTPWEEVDFGMAQAAEWSKNRNTIGFNWKHFDGSGYQIDQNKLFLIKDRNGLMYKLRFISFYNQQGEKGHPRFEVVKF